MLKISRADVTGEKILNYPDGYLKVPIEPYLELLKIDPLKPQKAIINAVNNPKYRFIVAAICRRLGKTFIANVIGQVVTLVPGSDILVISPNYSLSQISFDLQRQLIRHFDIEVRRDNAKDKIIELEHGSTVRMGSVNQVDSTVGRSYDLIIFDEAALEDGRDAFNVALRPTLDKPNSKALFISTPRGRNNWFAEFYDRGFSDQFPEWVSIQADYHENPRMTQSDIEEARRSMSEAEFRQEYHADFNIFEGQIWNFDFENCVKDLSELDTSKMDIFAGLDVGFRDPTAFMVAAYDWDSQLFYILAEYHKVEDSTPKHAEAIQKLINDYLIDYIFIDSAHQQTRFDLAQMFDISTINAKKDVNAGIGYVGGLVDNNRIIVDQRCKHTLEALDQYQWDPNPNLIREKPKHNFACHMADAIRYGFYSFETSTTDF
jgi:hypothetical protein